MTRPVPAGESAAASTALAPRTVGRSGAVRRGRPGPWYPDRNQRELIQIATRICGHCPIRAQCLDYAPFGADTWGGIATGIWGGTTPQERDQLRQQRKPVAA
jgi:Transcription factor WhiB